MEKLRVRVPEEGPPEVMVKMKNSCSRFPCTLKKTESWENQQGQQQLLNGAVCSDKRRAKERLMSVIEAR